MKELKTLLPLLLALATECAAAPSSSSSQSAQQPLAAPLEKQHHTYTSMCSSYDLWSCARRLTAPAPPEPRRKLQGRFLHITDVHPDPHYRVGSSEKKACHRGTPKEGKAAAGYYGLSYRCVQFLLCVFLCVGFGGGYFGLRASSSELS